MNVLPLENSRRVAAFRGALLTWFDAHKRDLPWRRTRDPYSIWLSEVMLQQTTVRTVEPRWERFLARWPTVDKLAAASEADVLHEWTGLGYYARARNLHRAARIVARAFDGVFPNSFELLLALPGMGPYASAAVASIAFQEPVAVVDANVERVVARLFADDTPIKSTVGKRAAKAHADALLSRERPGDFNQAMMELGAAICLPRKPRCAECPVAKYCAAYLRKEVHRFPVLPEKKAMTDEREVAIAVRRGDEVLMLRRPANASFGGMWEFPRVRCSSSESTADACKRANRTLLGIEIDVKGPIMKLRHVVMNSRIRLSVFTAELDGRRIAPSEHEEARWLTPEQALTLPKSTTQTAVLRFMAFGELPTKAEKEEPDDSPDLFR